jgi:hypothetical protein
VQASNRIKKLIRKDITMKMKTKIFSWALAIGAMAFTGCDKQDFVELNTNPDVLYSIRPEEQFFHSCAACAHAQDFEQFHENYRRINSLDADHRTPWLALMPLPSQSGEIRTSAWVFFTLAVGSTTTDVAVSWPKNMPEADRAARQMLVAMAEVVKIQYAFLCVRHQRSPGLF